MFEITVNVNTPDILKAAELIAKILSGASKSQLREANTEPHTEPVVNPTPASAPSTRAANSAPIPTAVPVSPAPQITGEMVAKAGADLISSNPSTWGPLNALLQKYGVGCAQELKPDQIGAFATEMRALGANI